MAKSFHLKIKQSPDSIFAKVQQEAKNQGYMLSGDASKGAISGSGIRGSYIFNSHNELILTIHDKPVLLSWTTIEKKLLSFLVE